MKAKRTDGTIDEDLDMINPEELDLNDCLDCEDYDVIDLPEEVSDYEGYQRPEVNPGFSII